MKENEKELNSLVDQYQKIFDVLVHFLPFFKESSPVKLHLYAYTLSTHGISPSLIEKAMRKLILESSEYPAFAEIYKVCRDIE